MKRVMFFYMAWPLVALGCLLAGACLTGVWYINKLEADLGRAIQHDVKHLQAAEQMQIWLRQLRFHSLLYAAQRSTARRREVLDDEKGFETALVNFRKGTDSAEDADLAEKISLDYERYKASIDPPEETPVASLQGNQLLSWADEHPVQQLLIPCRELSEREQNRMNATLQRNESQNRWAGRGLLATGCVGVLGGILSGYAAARRYSRAVGLLSVRVQAAQAQLDQEVGTLTVAAPQHLGELDQQLDVVVRRIREMCERLQHQEREILRTEQLAAVGQLAAGVAHEVRNPLTGIKFLIEAAMRPGQTSPLTLDDLKLIHLEILRMERTVQELLNFARVPPLESRIEDIGQLVHRVVEVARGRADQQRVKIIPSVPDAPLPASVDRDQFVSMLTNLLLNALDATPPGGSVGILVKNSDGDLKIDVTDTGSGIPPTVMEKLFTPFTTTKPTGTGLGLSVARRIARDHGGTLMASNRAEGGACFTFTLPAKEATHGEIARR
jgi:signal transduction histidine kinase